MTKPTMALAELAEKQLIPTCVREKAVELLQAAVNAECAEFLERFAERRDEAGRRAVVRNGYLPERRIATGLGPVAVKVPRLRDRSGEGIRVESRRAARVRSLGRLPAGTTAEGKVEWPPYSTTTHLATAACGRTCEHDQRKDGARARRAVHTCQTERDGEFSMTTPWGNFGDPCHSASHALAGPILFPNFS